MCSQHRNSLTVVYPYGNRHYISVASTWLMMPIFHFSVSSINMKIYYLKNFFLPLLGTTEQLDPGGWGTGVGWSTQSRRDSATLENPVKPGTYKPSNSSF